MARRKPLGRDLAVPLAGGLEEITTPHVGVAGLIELGRQSNVMAAAAKYLPGKQSPKGLGQDQLVESFVILSALGGDCVDDFAQLRRDAGLEAMLGYPLPAPATARQWLDRFHEEGLLEARPAQGTDDRLTDDGLTPWHPAFLQLSATLDGCARRYRQFCRDY